MGAMLMKIVILLRENESHMAKNLVLDGGDASENCDFQSRKQRLQGCKIFEYHKMALLFRLTKFEIEKQNMSGNLEDHKMALLFR